MGARARGAVGVRFVIPPPPRWTGHGRIGPKWLWTLVAWGAGGQNGSAPSPRATLQPRASRAYAGPCAVLGVRAAGVRFPPTRTGHGRKGPKWLGRFGAWGSVGRTGSAPSPRAALQRASRSYAGPGAVWGAHAATHARGAVFPHPPWTGHGRKGQKVAWTLGARGAGGAEWVCPEPLRRFFASVQVIRGLGAFSGTRPGVPPNQACYRSRLRLPGAG